MSSSPFDILKGKRMDLSEFIKQQDTSARKSKGGLSAMANKNSQLNLAKSRGKAKGNKQP